MATKVREKRVAVCVGCEAICTVWKTPDGEVSPISNTFGCDCDEPILRVLDAETLL